VNLENWKLNDEKLDARFIFDCSVDRMIPFYIKKNSYTDRKWSGSSFQVLVSKFPWWILEGYSSVSFFKSQISLIRLILLFIPIFPDLVWFDLSVQCTMYTLHIHITLIMSYKVRLWEIVGILNGEWEMKLVYWFSMRSTGSHMVFWNQDKHHWSFWFG